MRLIRSNERVRTYSAYRDMTQQQVADLMGLTQVKVSREEKKIMAYMREQFS